LIHGYSDEEVSRDISCFAWCSYVRREDVGTPIAPFYWFPGFERRDSPAEGNSSGTYRPGHRLTDISGNVPDLQRRAFRKKMDDLTEQIARLECLGASARQTGQEAAAEEYFLEAFNLGLEAVKAASHNGVLARIEALQTAANLALDCGHAAAARDLIDNALTLDASLAETDEWAELRDVTAWPDAWLVAAVRRDPPDTLALDTLAERHWKALFGRCQLLTVDREKANDLAQEAWCRLLRARHGLKPGGNFPAYLTMIATNLWRDKHRSARRAGPLAEERLLALDAALPGEKGESIPLGDVLPDLNARRSQEQTVLAMDIDKALERLNPQLRDVLVARFLTGESCAEIGRRYRRTEQTISSWVRAAVREIRSYFEEQNELPEAKENP
jgi:RNA polymerase sigma factor (sigma-70 family)